MASIQALSITSAQASPTSRPFNLALGHKSQASKMRSFSRFNPGSSKLIKTTVSSRLPARNSSRFTTSMALHYWEGPGGMQEFLRDKVRVRSLECEELQEAMQPKQQGGAEKEEEGEGLAGLVLLDVRQSQDFKDSHVPGSVNVPLYVPLQGMDMKSLMRRAVYAVNGMSGTQLNEDFLAQAKEAVQDLDTPVAVICSSGGTLEASSSAGLEGKRSRSLIAMYQLIKEGGFTNVMHVAGGIREWGILDLPMEGEDLKAWKKKVSAMP